MTTQEPVELQFRDGKRWVPAHLANLMADFETFKLTYDDALREANNKMTRDFTNDAIDGVIQRHFRRN